MIEPTAEELEEIVRERTGEVLAILYKQATEEWAAAHIQVAMTDAEISRITARKFHLETILQNRRKDARSGGTSPNNMP